jgi:hypothetical protein
MNDIYFKRWGVRVYQLEISWWDMWNNTPLLEIVWRNKNGTIKYIKTYDPNTKD